MPESIANLSLLLHLLQHQPSVRQALAMKDQPGQEQDRQIPIDLRRAVARWENEGGAIAPA